MLRHEHLWIPSTRHKNCVYTAREWCSKDIRDLQPDEEGECHDERRVAAVRIVRGLGEDDVEVGEQRTRVADKEGAEGQDRTDQAFLHEAC